MSQMFLSVTQNNCKNKYWGQSLIAGTWLVNGDRAQSLIVGAWLVGGVRARSSATELGLRGQSSEFAHKDMACWWGQSSELGLRGQSSKKPA